MPNRHKLVLDVEFNIEVSEHLAIKPSIIIDDNGVWKFESANDWFSEKAFDFALDDMRQEFYFYLFSKVVDDDDEELPLSGCWEK